MQAAPQKQIASAFSTKHSTMHLSPPHRLRFVLNRDAARRELGPRGVARSDTHVANEAATLEHDCTIPELTNR